MENECKIKNNHDSKFTNNIKEYKDKFKLKKIPKTKLPFNNIDNPFLPPIKFSTNNNNYNLLLNGNISQNQQLNFNNQNLPDLYRMPNIYNLNDFNSPILYDKKYFNNSIVDNSKKEKVQKFLNSTNAKKKYSKIKIKEINELKSQIESLEQKSNKLEYVNNILFQMIKIKNQNSTLDNRNFLLSKNHSCENINIPSKRYLNHNYYIYNEDNNTNINNISNLNKEFIPQDIGLFNYLRTKGQSRYYQKNNEGRNNFEIENEKNMGNIIGMINKMSMKLNDRLFNIEKSQKLQKNQIKNIIRYSKSLSLDMNILNKINKKSSINKKKPKIPIKYNSNDKVIKNDNKEKQFLKSSRKKSIEKEIKNKKEKSKIENFKQEKPKKEKYKKEASKREKSKKEVPKKELQKKEFPKENLSKKETLNKKITKKKSIKENKKSVNNKSNSYISNSKGKESIKPDGESAEKSNKNSDDEEMEKEENCPPPIAFAKNNENLEEIDLKSFSSLEFNQSDEV